MLGRRETIVTVSAFPGAYPETFCRVRTSYGNKNMCQYCQEGNKSASVRRSLITLSYVVLVTYTWVVASSVLQPVELIDNECSSVVVIFSWVVEMLSWLEAFAALRVLSVVSA